MRKGRRAGIAALAVVAVLLGGLSGTGHALVTTIDFEGVAPGIYSSLTVSGFTFTGNFGRDLQIVDLASFGAGLSKAITAADISSPTYDKSWGIRMTAPGGGPLGVTAFDVEGWADTAGHPQASGFIYGGCDSSTCIETGRLTDALLGYETISTGGTLNFFVVGSGFPVPTPNPSPGFVFFDNFTVRTADLAVPEPGPFALLLTGLCGLAARAWARRKA